MLVLAKEDKTEVEKEETVYVITDASGTSTDVIVEEWLKNGSAQDVHNQERSQKELPVSIKITYYLDGKEIAPENLAGKSGKIKIRYDYKNQEEKTVTIAGNKETVYVPFTVMSGMIFSDTSIKNVSVNSGKVISKEDQTIVVGMAFPGFKESLERNTDSNLDLDIDFPDYLEVTFETECFEMEMGASLIMDDALSDLDLENLEIREELKDAMEELSDGAQKLVDGSGELADGVEELHEKLPDFTDGVKKLQEGIVEYTDGVSSVNSGVGALKSGSSQLVNGVGTLSSGADSLATGSDTLADGAMTLADGMEELYKGAIGTKNGSKQLLNGYTGESGAVEGGKNLAKGAKQLDKGMAELVEGSAVLGEGANALSAGIAGLQSGAIALDEGAGQLNESANELKSGAEQISGYSDNLVRGIENVSTGLEQIQGMLKGDDTNPNQIAQLQTAFNQIEAAIGSQEDGDYSLQNCYSAIAGDVAALYEAYMNQGESDLTTYIAEGNIENKISLETAASAKADAQSQKEAASQQMSAANGAYQNAWNAYQPIASNIKSTLDTIGLSQYAGYVDDAQGTAASVSGAYQSAQGSYEAAISSYEQTIAEYEAVIAKYEEMLDGQIQMVALESPSVVETMDDSVYATWVDLQTQIETMGAILNGQDQEQTPGLQDSLETIETTLFGDGESIDGAFAELTVAIDQLYTGVGQRNTEDSSTILGGARALQAGNSTLSAGASALVDGMGSLKAGTEELRAGTTQLAEAAPALVSGAGEFVKGIQNAKEGSKQLAIGADQLSSGIQILYSGTKELDKGLGTLETGASDLQEGSKSLEKGAAEFAKGADTLAFGASELENGANTLNQGISSLQSGVFELDSNSSKLINGTGELSQGTDQLVDGVEKLKDGAEELKDGMEELNEDGIQKLKKIFVDDVDEMIERLQAIQKVGDDYQSFVGMNDEMNGNVKFIIRTEGITKEG